MKHYVFSQRNISTILVILIMLFYAGSSSAAGGVTTMLRFPELNIKAGEHILLKVYFSNESQEAVDFTLPDTLPLRFQASDRSSVLVTAVETDVSQDVTLQPGEFITRDYKIVIPLRYRGTMDISLVDSPETEVLLNIIDGEPDSKDMLAGPAPDVNADYPSLESLHSLYQPYVVNFSEYEPIYFLVGTDPEESKFQISLRYRPFNPAGSLTQRYPWLSGFNFAYTQTSFWDLASDSAPFEDTSYKPEMFYLTRNWATGPGMLKGLFFQGGFRHESNGQDGDSSRSTNTLYFRPVFIFYDAGSELGLQIGPKLLAYINNSEGSNPDLDDYRGNVDFEVKFGKASGIVSTTHLQVAKHGTSIQTDLSYPISKLLKNNLDLFLYVQYSNSLAEELLNYKERNEALRIGISIVR